MLQRIWHVFSLWTVCALIMWGAGNVCAQSESDITHIIQRGYLVVGVCQIDQPPFYVRDRYGKLSGYDIDLAMGLAKDLGVKLKFNERAQNWDELVDQLISGEIDLAVSFLSKMPSRAKSILYSRPYSKVNQALLVNRLSLGVLLKNDLNTLKKIFSKDSPEKLIVYSGSSYIKFAKNLFPDIKLVTYPDRKGITGALMRGEGVGFLSDHLEIKNYIDAISDARLKLLPLILRDDFDLIAIGVRPNYRHLLHFVDTYLETHAIDIKIDSSAQSQGGNLPPKVSKEAP